MSPDRSGRGLLIVLSGPGAVGKDTLIGELLRRDPSIRYSVSYTTRPRRPYELDGEHYSFVDEAGFDGLVADEVLLEHAFVNGYRYGTSRERVDEARDSGTDVILKIDVAGAEQVRQRVCDAFFIFLRPPSMQELIERRQARQTETEEEQQRRQELAEKEMTYADRYDVQVVNDDLERAVSEVLSAIEARRTQP